MTRRKTPSKSASRKSRPKETGHFVGRAGSPVLDKYPKKAMDAAVGEPIPSAPAASRVPVANPTASGTPGVKPGPIPSPNPPSLAPGSGVPKLLISLEKPFDVDDFSQLLGQTHIQVTVPRDSLAEVLRRACDFMGFGIYVYTIRVRPGPEELLKTFIVELQRVDYSGPAKDWAPFQDRGRSDNPFGPTGTR
jgi:hypothetical protein